MPTLGELFNFRQSATLTEDEISDAEGVQLSDGLGLDVPGNYPNALWSAQSEKYRKAYKYFSGEVLSTKADVETDDGSQPLLYPLQINFIQAVVFILQAAFLGEYDDDNVVSWRVKPDKDKEAAKELQEFINQTFIENDRDGLLISQASTLQTFGGCVWRARFDPAAPHSNGIVIEGLPPDEFYPVWDSADMHRILEYIFARQINRREAQLKYSVDLEDNGTETALYQEHWTEYDYRITIEGEQAMSPYDRSKPLRGPNPFVDPRTRRSFLPVEYQPAWRAPIDSFYGIGPVESIFGLQDEINLQLANIGDTVAENAHRQMWIRGMSKVPKRFLRDPNVIMNLGIGVPNHVDPELGVVDPPDLPSGTNDFVEILMDLARNLSFTPRVVWGIDEGSQRSALTLAFRMWQLLAKTRVARVFAMSALASFSEKLAMMGINKQVGGLGVEHLGHEILTEFAPAMPQDRKDVVEEVVQLASVDRIGLERSVELLGHVDDVDEEVQRIKEYIEWKADMEAKMQPSPFGENGGNGENNGGSPNRSNPDDDPRNK